MLSIILAVLVVALLVVVLMQRVALIKVRSARALRRKNIGTCKEAVDPVNYLHDRGTSKNIGKHGEVVDQVKKTGEVTGTEVKSEDVDVILGLKTEQLQDATTAQAVDDESPLKHSEPCEVAAAIDIQPETLPLKKLDVIVIHVQAQDERPYSGYELLQSILSAGLRYGDMNIFHRFEKKTGRGGVKYSLSSAVSPGSFDLTNMGAFSSPALTLFLKPATLKDPMQSFEEMLHTAGQLVDDLGGVVLDDAQQPLTQATVREICLQIKSLQPSQHNMDLFEQI